jgi:hypothetical protein
MSRYSFNQLKQRDIIIQSQKLFWNFLDSTMMNKLVHLFDENSSNSHMKITNIIEKERNKQGLDSSDVSGISEVYGHILTNPKADKNPTLYFGIKKYAKDFLHLTIHLAPGSLKANANGPIHFYKTVYEIKGSVNNQDLSNKKLLYAIILVSHPANKPKSLEFSIGDGYTTPGIKDAPYDHELQQEMNVIITVLNRLFDEDNSEFYIGNEDKLVPIHKNTNIVLNGINIRSKIVTLKNKGKRMYPPLNNNSKSGNKYMLHKKSQTREISRRTNKSGTRKIRVRRNNSR